MLEFNLQRKEVPLVSIDASYKLTDELGYIKVNRFSETTYKEFKVVLEMFQVRQVHLQKYRSQQKEPTPMAMMPTFNGSYDQQVTLRSVDCKTSIRPDLHFPQRWLLKIDNVDTVRQTSSSHSPMKMGFL